MYHQVTFAVDGAVEGALGGVADGAAAAGACRADRALPVGDRPGQREPGAAFIDAQDERARDHEAVRVGSARIARCVAAREGIGRFVYLIGRSGRRYVFCGIERSRVRLYDRAIFGLRDGDGMALSARASAVGGLPGLLYIHLMEEGGADEEAIIADLAG